MMKWVKVLAAAESIKKFGAAMRSSLLMFDNLPGAAKAMEANDKIVHAHHNALEKVSWRFDDFWSVVRQLHLEEGWSPDRIADEIEDIILWWDCQMKGTGKIWSDRLMIDVYVAMIEKDEK